MSDHNGFSQVQMSQRSQNYSPTIIKTKKQSNLFCSILILLLFVTIYVYICSIYLNTEALLTRINYQEGSIKQFMPIYSAEIHYSRIPHQYWQHRMEMVKAMGFNSISVYVMWNYHELEKGVFDFQTNNKNLAKFLKIAANMDLKVLLRPGPYVCAQWDFGGLPARLLGNQELEIRVHNQLYEQEVKIYFENLAKVIRPFMYKANHGPITLIQIQNQLGSLNSDKAHTYALLKMWIDLNISAEFYYQDAPWYWEKHYWSGAHVGLSQGGTVKEFADIDMSPLRDNRSLVFGGQIYTGWLTHWGQKINGRDRDEFKEHFKHLLDANRSLSLFVAHGGTNFGLTAGANGFPNNDYMPHITSYDYDAPINQRGAPTQKYHDIREIVSKKHNMILPQIPQEMERITIPPIKMQQKAYFFSKLPKPTLFNSSLTYFQSNSLQMYDQGFVLYQTTLNGKGNHIFNITFRDFAMIYIDGKFSQTLSREKLPSQEITIPCEKDKCQLRILVEAMGHINYGIKQKTDRKGLIQFRQIGNSDSLNNNLKWNIYKIPINLAMTFWKGGQGVNTFPIIREGSFAVEKAGDTFFDLSKYTKGYVWINNILLGRYWNKGPQLRLYCPGPWLRQGSPNQIMILELLDDKEHQITGQLDAFTYTS